MAVSSFGWPQGLFLRSASVIIVVLCCSHVPSASGQIGTLTKSSCFINHCNPMLPRAQQSKLLSGCPSIHPSKSEAGLRQRPSILQCTGPDDSASVEGAAAKLAILSIPLEPSADLSAEDVVRAICAGLQHNDLPSKSTGLVRLYNLSDLKCRSAITARQGAKSVERFIQYAEHSLLAPLTNCDRWTPQPPTIIPAPPDSPTRGDLATQVVLVHNKINFRYRSGLERPAGAENETEEATPFRFTLERQRRPPLAGCWLVTELLCLRDEFIFNGDTGAVQG